MAALVVGMRRSYLIQYSIAFLLAALFPYLVSLSVYAGEVGEYCFFPIYMGRLPLGSLVGISRA